MYRILILFFAVLSISAFSQDPGAAGRSPRQQTGTIRGIIVDSISKEGISFASVGLLDQVTGNVVNGSIADENGLFTIIDCPIGTYKLQIVFIGYTTKEIANLELTTSKSDLNLGRIIISPTSRLLEEIRVVGEAAIIEARPDKIVYNAEKDVNSRGGDAADVLRNVPLLAVDFDGNVTMRGSENIRILINGRPSGIFNASVADALKMMPADQIKAVEVITAPSARYDGEGTAGIINIITKKKNIEGLAGSVDLTTGTRSNRGNMNLNYGKGRLGFNLSGGGHYTWPQEGTTSFRREEFGAATPSLLTQDGLNRSSRLGYRINAGLEYNLNDFNTLNTSLSFRGHNVDNKNDVLSSYSLDNSLEDVYRRITTGYSSRSGLDWEGSYRKTYTKKGQEWSVAFELDKDDDISESQYNVLYAIPESQPDELDDNNNAGDNLEFAIQTDYVHPLNENVVVETGAKATLRSIDNDFSYLQYNSDLNDWIVDPTRTDIFFYDQNVYAGYVNSTFNLDKKTTLIAGLRLEVTDLQGEFQEFVSPFANTYTSLLPNVTLSRKTGEFNQVRISYNQRIQRPNQRNVNPFIEYNDARDISYGNPTLGPELVQQIEAGTNLFIKGSMINLAVFGRRTDDLIESLLRITDEGVSETTYENFGVRFALGLNAFGSVNIGEKLSVRGGFDINYFSVEGIFDGEDLANTGFDYNGRVTITWNLSETLKMEGFSFFRSPTNTVQGTIPNWVMSSFAIKQEFFKKKLVIGLSVFQPFRENQTWKRELSGDYFYQNNTTVRPVRSIGINIGYRFGKLETKERSGKKRMNLNDLKDDQGGESQF